MLTFTNPQISIGVREYSDALGTYKHTLGVSAVVSGLSTKKTNVITIDFSSRSKNKTDTFDLDFTTQ
jgi:hypothetical protein